MRKAIIILTILISLISPLAAEVETKTFTLEFNKSLPVDMVFYDPDKYSNPSSTNPPEELNSISFTSPRYGTASNVESFGIFWNLDTNTLLEQAGGNTVRIDMYFYAETASSEVFNYMLRSSSDGTKGLNYNVSCVAKSDGSSEVGGISTADNDPTKELDIDSRTINLASGIEHESNISDWYEFEIQVPAFTSVTSPLGEYNGKIALVLRTI